MEQQYDWEDFIVNNKIAIITDTNSGISQEEADSLNVILLPMPFIINDTMYFEGINLSQDEFYAYLEQDADISTSQPSPGDVMDLWDETLKTYDFIIHIPMSSGLSGSMESATMLAQDYDGKVLVVDNKRISASLRQAVLDAVAWRSQGHSAEEIKEKLEATALDACIYLSVDTLKYLKKGGRVTPAAAALGTVLNIKPILQLQGGKLDAYKKVRGNKAAIKEVLKAMDQEIENRFKGKEVYIHTAYSGSVESGEEWNRIVKEHFPDYDVYNARLPLSIVCHTGAGVCGILCIVKNN